MAFINTAIVLILVGATLLLVGLLIYLPEQITRAIGPGAVIVLAIIGRLLLMCGKTRLAVFVLVVGFWGIATGIAFFNGGVHATIVITYPMVIGLAAWLISVRAAVTMTALTVGVTIGFVLAESWQLLPVSPPTLPVLHGIMQIILFVTYAAVATLLVRDYQDRLKVLSQHKRDLQKREAEVHRAQAVSSVGSWVYDPATDTLHMSTEICRIFGLPAGTKDNRGGYFARIYLPDRQPAECAWQEALQSGVFEHAHRIVVGDSLRWIHQKAEVEFAADGSVRWAAAVGELVRDGTDQAARMIGTTIDITQRKQAEEKIAQLAFFDPLTSLPNRTLFTDRLRQSMTASARSASHGALLYIDLNNFKRLNDSFGHDMGDLLLIEVARRLERCVRAGDAVARLGGDEFVVVLSCLGLESGEATSQVRGPWARRFSLRSTRSTNSRLRFKATPPALAPPCLWAKKRMSIRF